MSKRKLLSALSLTSIILLTSIYVFGALKSFGELHLSYSISEAEIEVLEDKEYYRSLIQEIREAEKEVLVAMYLMKYDPSDPQDWANDLIRELVNAKERGVSVRVMIEYRTYLGYMDDNLKAYSYLKEHGVDVKLDDDAETDHFKFIVIDGRVAYIGSHNWSESSLHYNREVSIKIVDEGIARELKEYFNSLWST